MKNDRRVIYTKMVLKQSLLESIQEKPVGKITVKELCEKSGINRATFYAHYNDVYDMLEQIENELYETISRSLDKGWSAGSMFELLSGVCSDIKLNGEVCKVILSDNGDKNFLNRILYVAQDKCVAEWKALAPDADTEKLEKVYSFFSHGSAAVILSWVGNGMQENPAEIAGFIQQITEKGLGLLQNDAKSSF